MSTLKPKFSENCLEEKSEIAKTSITKKTFTKFKKKNFFEESQSKVMRCCLMAPHFPVSYDFKIRKKNFSLQKPKQNKTKIQFVKDAKIFHHSSAAA